MGGATLWALGAVSASATVAAAVAFSLHNQVDIDVYLAGASRLFSGTLYTTRTPGNQLWFTYPPTSALFFLPLNALPLQWARTWWALVNAASLWLLLAVSLRAVRPSMGRPMVVKWSLALMGPTVLLYPVMLTFAYGQINLLLAAAILVDLTQSIQIGRVRVPRGVLTGIAAALKLTPLVFIPFLFLTRQVREALTSLGVFIGCAMAMAVLAPKESWSFWTRYVQDTKRIGRTFSFNNQSIASVLYRFNHGPVPGAVTLLFEGVVLIAGTALAVWAYRSSSAFLGIIVCAVTGLMASPVTWTHHIVWIVPLLVWLVLADDRPRGGWVWALVGACTFVHWWAPNWHSWARGSSPLDEHGLQLVGGSGLFMFLLTFQLGIAIMLVHRSHRRSAALAVQKLEDKPPTLPGVRVVSLDR